MKYSLFKQYFRKYIEDWARLAQKHGHTYVKTYIEKSLRNEDIKNGHEVAFKSVIAPSELDSGVKDFTKSNSKFAWLSCGGKTDYCYLRDCPGEHIARISGCSGERFEVLEVKVRGHNRFLSGYVRNGGTVKIKSEDDHYLSMYTTRECTYVRHGTRDFEWQFACKKPWWTSRPFGGSAEKHLLRKKLGKKNEIIQNGDIIEMWWDYGKYGECANEGGLQHCSRSRSVQIPECIGVQCAPVYGSPFEVVKLDTWTETNKWTSKPSIPNLL